MAKAPVPTRSTRAEQRGFVIALPMTKKPFVLAFPIRQGSFRLSFGLCGLPLNVVRLVLGGPPSFFSLSFFAFTLLSRRPALVRQKKVIEALCRLLPGHLPFESWFSIR